MADIQAETDVAFVRRRWKRRAAAGARRRPGRPGCARNLFASVGDTILTLLGALASSCWVAAADPTGRFVNAAWTGSDRERLRQPGCRGVLGLHQGQVSRSSSTAAIRSRSAGGSTSSSVLLAARPDPDGHPVGAAKGANASLSSSIFPVVGAHSSDRRRFRTGAVETPLWGGLWSPSSSPMSGWSRRCRSASCWRSAGARSMPIVRTFCVAFIEFWRGVPLITVLFMA